MWGGCCRVHMRKAEGLMEAGQERWERETLELPRAQTQRLLFPPGYSPGSHALESYSKIACIYELSNTSLI